MVVPPPPHHHTSGSMPTRDDNCKHQHWQIGSIARVTHDDMTRRVVVATIDDQEATVLVENGHPPSRFLPVGGATTEEEEEPEWRVPIHQLESLLEFEQPTDATTTKGAANAATVKAHGDALLKLGDAPAAVSYYETALQRPTPPMIGASIVARHPQTGVAVAEVDCVNDDDDDDDDDDPSLDVCWTTTQQDTTLPASDHLLTIQEPHDNHLQTRILLNLTRCLLQIAETSSQAKRAYAQAAVQTATLAVVVIQHEQQQALDDNNNNNNNDDDDDVDNSTCVALRTTALSLRARAHGLQGQWTAAATDWQAVVPQSSEPQRRAHAVRMRNVARQEQQRAARREKKLVRNLCQWVNDATAPTPLSKAVGKAAVQKRRSKFDKVTT